MKEMFVDEDPQTGAQLSGEQQHRQRQHRAKQENHLGDRAPTAAEAAYVIAAGTHREQIDAGAEQRCRVKDNAPRYEDFPRPVCIRAIARPISGTQSIGRTARLPQGTSTRWNNSASAYR